MLVPEPLDSRNPRGPWRWRHSHYLSALDLPAEIELAQVPHLRYWDVRGVARRVRGARALEVAQILAREIRLTGGCPVRAHFAQEAGNNG